MDLRRREHEIDTKIKEMEIKRLENYLKNKQIQNEIFEMDLKIKKAEYELKLITC